jgi:hypothetical protein
MSLASDDTFDFFKHTLVLVVHPLVLVVHPLVLVVHPLAAHAGAGSASACCTRWCW